MTAERGHHLVLVGMMGVGKTTVGRRVAAELGRPFLDSDAVIEERTGRTVAEIFASEGEGAFRAIESDVLLEAIGSTDPAVIAAAGGTVLSEGNRVALRGAGTVVWLRAPVEHLVPRVEGSTHRPAVADDPLASLTRLAEGREELYRGVADVVVDASRSVDDVVTEIVNTVLAPPHTEHALIGSLQPGEPTHVREGEQMRVGESPPGARGTGP